MCFGAIDGKHISLQAPILSGSEYFNYKGFFSIVLMAVVDANYKFIFADVGCQGRISDGGIFDQITFKNYLEQFKLNLPSGSHLPGQSFIFPPVFVGDEAFPLTKNLMKPFPGTHKRGSKERIFNYRLSRARRVSENAFGILSSVFRFLRKPLLLEPKKAEKITLAALYLHNYLRRNSASRKIYNPLGFIDYENERGEIQPGAWRMDTSEQISFQNFRKVPRKHSDEAKLIREAFATYFVSSEGAVSWQNNIS